MPSSLTASSASSWDRFFFTPADPLPLALIRIACGALLLWSIGCLGLDLSGFLGSGGWVDPSTMKMLRPPTSLEWSFWNLVPDAMLRPVWVACMIVLGSFTLGLGSRVAAPLAWAIAVSTSRRNPFILFGFDQIVTLWAFYLAVSGASGQSLSIDRLIARKRGRPAGPIPTTSANLGLRMIQIHLAVIYGAAGLAKLRGISWWDGTAMLKLLSNAEFRPFDLMAWLSGSSSLYMLNLATHLALATEILYPVLIWKRAFRPWMIGAAALMHVGIAVTLGLVEFSMAMMAGNLAFVSGAWIRRMAAIRHGSRRAEGLESTDGPSPVTPSSPTRPASSRGRSR